MFPVLHKHLVTFGKFPVTTISSCCGYETVLDYMGLRAVLDADTHSCASGLAQILHCDGGNLHKRLIFKYMTYIFICSKALLYCKCCLLSLRGYIKYGHKQNVLP